MKLCTACPAQTASTEPIFARRCVHFLMRNTRQANNTSTRFLQADAAIDSMDAAPMVIFDMCGLKAGESCTGVRALWLFAEEHMSLVCVAEIGQRHSSDSYSVWLFFLYPSISNCKSKFERWRRNAGQCRKAMLSQRSHPTHCLRVANRSSRRALQPSYKKDDSTPNPQTSAREKQHPSAATPSLIANQTSSKSQAKCLNPPKNIPLTPPPHRPPPTPLLRPAPNPLRQPPLRLDRHKPRVPRPNPLVSKPSTPSQKRVNQLTSSTAPPQTPPTPPTTPTTAPPASS